MSSGKGDLSRVYKTVDACKTWKLVFTNPDQDGFFDGIRRVTGKQLYLLGDPVSGKFSMFLTQDQGDNWFIADDPGLDADKGDGGFAASNSSLISQNIFLYFGTGGATSPHVYHTYLKCDVGASNCAMAWKKADVPLEGGIPTAGIFSLSSRTDTNMAGKSRTIVIAVGGDYAKPDTVVANAATSNDGGETWSAAQTPPHGYRSSIAYDGATNSWITTGPNGTDISRDDGKNWSALKPSAQDAPDADKNWNALSLPFVVGPKGRIGKLRPNALKP
jgi:photosystem II stability/assembly factor-like uncharacterized protein